MNLILLSRKNRFAGKELKLCKLNFYYVYIKGIKMFDCLTFYLIHYNIRYI